MIHIYKLALTLKDDTRDNERTENERREANASAKSKELQPNTQSQRFAAHLLLPQPHNLTFDNLKLIQRNKCQEQKKKAIGFP
jgi:hypothetical protein